MAQPRHQIHNDQAPHGAPPSEFEAIIKRTVEATLEALSDRQLPARARVLRAEAAARYIGVDSDTLRDWRRKGEGPRFKRIGSRCVYTIEALDAFIDGLESPENSRRAKPAGAAQ